ncbi:MAG: hypothetical protein IPL97_13730 [Niastella sp.]|nr:hypothetical protein [Niastella sp.]
MSNLRKFFAIFIITALCSLGTFNAMAGDPDPGCNPDNPLCPIDGGLSLLIAAGIGLGAKKAYDRKKKTTGDI